ncbi:hypothetical protein [Butyrivibrio sp. WCD3002]|uniref:hypothetical protein n=1 Tax=Butyrivibrio sp. WCD3002 TaxID=1280676 RepID=UPI0012DC8190|nr:hypothetical protein [Butyrivibrio sp. WCD3002]
MSKVIRQGFEWLICLAIGFLIINLICFAYEREPAWMDTPNGATPSVREPYSILVHGSEGYSISRIDKNGYTNPDKELADKYILMLGASHVQGKEIAPEKKYSVLVNDYLYKDDLLHVYNIACDGSFLPGQIKYFKSAVEAFPNSEVIFLEVHDTDYSIDEIKSAMEQIKYDSNDTAAKFEDLSLKGKIKCLVKNSVPILSRIKKNIEAIKNASSSKTEYQVDIDEYEQVINESMELIRSEFDKPIIMVYHPRTELEKDGSMTVKYSKTWESFRKACVNNNIDVIDSGEDFVLHFNETKEVPYGFSNTTLCSGHLNAVGHQIIADEIIEYLEGINN